MCLYKIRYLVSGNKWSEPSSCSLGWNELTPKLGPCKTARFSFSWFCCYDNWIKYIDMPDKIMCINYLCMLSHSVVSNSLQPNRLSPTRLLCPWDSLGKNTGVDTHSLLQRICPTQALNPQLLISCIGRQFLYHEHHLLLTIFSEKSSLLDNFHLSSV